MTSYRPSSFYHRRRLRQAKTLAQARTAGLLVVEELEMVKAWARDRGLIPPKKSCPEEIEDIKKSPATEFQKSWLASIRKDLE